MNLWRRERLGLLSADTRNRCRLGWLRTHKHERGSLSQRRSSGAVPIPSPRSRGPSIYLGASATTC